MTTKYDGSNSLTYLLTLLKAHFAAKAEVPDAVSDLTNDLGFVTTDTTYAVSIDGSVITLTGSDGSTSTVTLPAGTTVDPTITPGGTNPVQGGAIYTALAGKTSPQDVSDAIDAALAGITGISFEIVQTLPATGDPGVFYLVPNGGASGNGYDEWIYTNNAWEKIGTTDVDLSGYVRTSDLVELTNTEVQNIWDAVFAS